MFHKHYVGLDLTGFENNGSMRPISRVTLLVDDENAVTAGDDTGVEIAADCPHATQAMADAILSSVKGYVYKMYSASAANLDPSVELGDGVTAGGIYSVISRVDDAGSYPDVSAPGEAEMEDEYPVEGPVTQIFNRKISETRSTISKTAEEIRLEVKKTTEELSASIQVNADAIEQRVTKDGVIAAINLSPEQITIQAGKISLEGIVTVNQTFQIDEQGFLRCTGGTIGGFTIGGTAIYNGLASFNGTENGVYVGTDGIALGGGKFKVTPAGALTSTSGTFESVTISGSTFSGSLNQATGSINGVTGSYGGSINSGGTFTGTHSGGTLSATGGTYYGGHYGNVVSNCNLGGTSLTVASGSGSYIEQT